MPRFKYHTGQHFPLGATIVEGGVNFALYSENATKIELCLFDSPDDEQEKTRIVLKGKTNHVWHAFLPDIKAGQLYGYRVYGPYDPKNGHRFNHHKLLLDPYTKAISGDIKWHDSLFGYETDHKDGDLSFSTSDSAPHMPKCVVVDDHFNWEDDKPLYTPYHKTIIYEAHIKGLTQLHPEIPEEIRGTYAAIAHPSIIAHLQTLGITAIELMPVQHFTEDRHLVKKGLKNYWGYQTIAFFAPHTLYSSTGTLGQQVQEFKQMVRALHKAGIEVILDVAYNHTGEADELGPSICFRGIDNLMYYRHPENLRKYVDYTGTGNTLNSRLPYVLQMIMDSLRYWIQVMHVDGFRFDLAATLARELNEVQKLSAFFDIIHQDPVISRVKLIAEPWDLGKDGYQVGEFPPGWAEWNGPYRDCMRKFWRGTSCQLAEFARKFTGSPDLYKNGYKTPCASINLITSHDGFTLRDMVSYKQKHNEENNNQNEDGMDDNHSDNYGEEGETVNEAIKRIRSKQQRNLLTSLFLSQGVPMLLSGDEIGNTQHGNNNSYCQDNEISWINWKNADKDLFQFTCRLIKIRKEHPSFRRRSWFRNLPIEGTNVKDIAWFSPNGQELPAEDWKKNHIKTLGVYMNGLDLHYLDENGEKVTDKNFYLVFNADTESIPFTLPGEEFGNHWQIILSTGDGFPHNKQLMAGATLIAEERSVILLECEPDNRIVAQDIEADSGEVSNI